jgi:hypothetical protein
MSDRPILFAYDGSDYAKAAIEQAAEQLESDRRAIVLTMWQRFRAEFVGVGVAPARAAESGYRGSWIACPRRCTTT